MFLAQCVCVCVYVCHVLDCVFDPVGLRVWGARGPDRVSMDGGAWLPLRIRYLPRWHHTGSYQLYQGEESGAADASNALI